MARARPHIRPVEQEDVSHPLKDGDGGGTFDAMEARVKLLEDRFEKMDSKLDTIIKDVSYLKGKVDSMPTSLQLLGFAIAVFVAAGLLRYIAP